MRRARTVQQLSNALLQITAESCPSAIGLITLDQEQTGERSGKSARYVRRGGEWKPTHGAASEALSEERRETDRPYLRSRAPFLDPTFRGGDRDVSIIRSLVRAIVLPDHHSKPATRLPPTLQTAA